MRTRKSPEVTSSEAVRLVVPRSWKDLTPAQFRTVCTLMSGTVPPEMLQEGAFLQLSGVRILARTGDSYLCMMKGRRRPFLVEARSLAFAVTSLDWLAAPPDLFDIAGQMACVHSSAVTPLLQTLTFGEYLACDSYFNGYIIRRDPELLRSLTALLFPKLRRPKRWQQTAALIWYTAFKTWLPTRYRELFTGERREENLLGGPADDAEAVRDSLLALVRALTKGDITKTERVMAANVHTALVELDQMARETREMQSNLKK